ncbi:hypothetical protein [Alkalihalobacillus sp. LMS39]|uniref:hypothetical protein n=1 Tax=Alkalihalobacillus sp. LMS39 TaxID=2924032 RepID=UPI001FB25DCA|nr:hypothetical protein [Alkalihalobacillus sp. LMS39]UOE94828.1 hypothetical protein MM271_04045 [Alkalihalobacillus sp. LMS39]
MLDSTVLEDIQSYLDLHLQIKSFAPLESEFIVSEMLNTTDLKSFIKTKRKPTLKNVLFTYIDKKGKTDAEIYKKAGLDRRHFSKIKNEPRYRPKKNTILNLAIALELQIDETEDLLNSAGYSLSQSETFDLIVQYFIENKMYDILLINEALEHFEEKLLVE